MVLKTGWLKKKPEEYYKGIEEDKIKEFLKAKAEDRKIKLVDFEARELLEICHIHSLPTVLAYTRDEAAAKAFETIIVSARRFLLRVPVLGITIQKMVESGKEVIVGFSRDPQFGPLMMFGLGKVPAVFATIIYATPPVIRLKHMGIQQVPGNVVKAAQAFGTSKRQILFKA